MVICLERGAFDGAADATATPSSRATLKSRMVYLSGAGLARLSWKRGCYKRVVVHMFYNALLHYCIANGTCMLLFAYSE